MRQENSERVRSREGQIVNRSRGDRRRGRSLYRSSCGRRLCGPGCGSLGLRSRLVGGLISGLFGGRQLEALLLQAHGRVGVGGQDAGLITPGIVDCHVEPVVLRQQQRPGGQIRQCGGSGQADLDDVLDAQTTLIGRGQEDILGLDPADRRGELPGEQLDEQLTSQLDRPVLPSAPVLDDGLDRLGGDDIEDRPGEFGSQFEGARHEVGHIAPHETIRIKIGRHEGCEALAELGNAGAEYLGVERHINARHEHEGVLAAVSLGLGAGIGCQGLQALNGARHGVLHTCEVVVDDLKELAGLLSDPSNVVLDLSRLDAGLVGAQSPHAVVRGAVLVALDQGVHGGAALEDDGDRRLHGHDTPIGAQGGVLPQRVPGEGGALNQSTGLGQARGGGYGNGRQSDLGELGEIEQPLRVAIGHTASGHLGGVVAHQGDDGEAELCASVGVGALPDLACGLGAVHLVQTHTAGLDALTGIDVGGRLGLGHGSAAGDDLIANAAGDLQDEAAAAHEPGALNADLHAIAKLDRTQHDIGPPRQDVAGAVSSGGGRHLLSGRRQPHAVDQRRFHAGDLGRMVTGVDGVEIAGHTSEGGHVGRCRHGDAAQQTTRGRRGVAPRPPGQLGAGGHGSARGPPADGEALAHEGDQRAVGGVGQFQAHIHDPSRAGLLQGGDPPVDLNDGLGSGLRMQLGQRTAQIDGVVEMDGPQQSLNERHAVLDDAAQSRIDHGPARAEQGVGDQRGGRQGRRQGVRGHRGVVGSQGVRQRETGVDGAERLSDGAIERVGGSLDGGDHLRQVLDEIPGDGDGPDSCGGAQEIVHGLTDALGIDKRCSPVPGASQAQGNHETAHGVHGLPTGSRVPMSVEADVQVVGVLCNIRTSDDLVGVLRQHASRIDGQMPVPQHVRRGADQLGGVSDWGAERASGHLSVEATGGDLLRYARVLKGLNGRSLETTQQVTDGLIDRGDARHRNRTGNDAHLVGGVARVLGLPQGVGAPPAQDVGVDHGHEGHGLGVLAAQVDEPGGVDGLHQGGDG